MKKFFLFTVFIFIVVTGFSQDIITYVRGVKIEVIVTRITETQIMFRLFSDQRGTEYFAYKKNVESIKYRDGRVETYNPSSRQISEYVPNANQQISNSSTNQRGFNDDIYFSTQKTDNNTNEKDNQQVTTSNTYQTMNNWNQTSDIILFRNGTRRMVNVLEITPEVIKYRDFDNPTGAIYSIRKSDVTRIIFQNGREETFSYGFNSLENNYDQNEQQFYFGLGFGLDYGGFGGKIEYLPVKYFGLFGGLGYNLLSAGWNVGASVKILPDYRVSPNLVFFYGYNGMSKVVNYSYYDMTSYGISFGINLDIRVGSKGNNKWSLGVYVPIRSKEFMDNYEAMKNDKRLEMLNNLYPIAGGIGYNFRF